MKVQGFFFPKHLYDMEVQFISTRNQFYGLLFDSQKKIEIIFIIKK